ncbi:hypothetical protein AB6B38_09555 [Glycocaulis abyssi]|uniref:Uncharacterized protein n=1 Tax=Glycocaulis abyssi TaxID=1433403 RepID=A0ABV9NFU6_9PROT
MTDEPRADWWNETPWERGHKPDTGPAPTDEEINALLERSYLKALERLVKHWVNQSDRTTAIAALQLFYTREEFKPKGEDRNWILKHSIECLLRAANSPDREVAFEAMKLMFKLYDENKKCKPSG